METILIFFAVALVLLLLAVVLLLNRRVRDLGDRLAAVEYAVEHAPVASGPGVSPMGAGGGGW